MYNLSETRKQEAEQILLGHLPFTTPKIYADDSPDQWVDFLARFLSHKDDAVVARAVKGITEWLPQLKDDGWFRTCIRNSDIPAWFKEELLKLAVETEMICRYDRRLVCENNIWEQAAQPKEAFLNTVTILLGKKSWKGIVEELKRYLALTFTTLPFEWESEEEVDAVRARLVNFFPKDILLFANYFPWDEVNEKWQVLGKQKISDVIKLMSNSKVDEWNRDSENLRKYYWDTPSNEKILESLRSDVQKLFTNKQAEVSNSREAQRISEREREDKALHKACVQANINKCLNFAQELKDFSTYHPEIYDKRLWNDLPLDILDRGHFSYLTYATYLMRYIGSDPEPVQEDIRDLYLEDRESVRIRFTYKDERFFGQLLSIFLKIDNFLKKKKAKEERRRDKAEKLKQAQAEWEQCEQERREQARETWQELIARRCRQIVNIFNGLFDAEIDPDAVLAGEISGAFASIQSGGSSSPSVGLGLKIRQTLSLEQHLSLRPNTWLTLEEGAEEKEWQAAYRSENLLIWHELCHLVSPQLINNLLSQVLERPPDYRLPADAHAKEVVIDGLAILFGETFYVHPDKGRTLSKTVRRRAMLESHLAMVERAIAWYAPKELEESDKLFLSRLLSELDVHGESEGKATVWPQRQALQGLIGQDLSLPFAQLYKMAAKLNVQTITVQKSLSEQEENYKGGLYLITAAASV